MHLQQIWSRHEKSDNAKITLGMITLGTILIWERLLNYMIFHSFIPTNMKGFKEVYKIKTERNMFKELKESMGVPVVAQQ